MNPRRAFRSSGGLRALRARGGPPRRREDGGPGPVAKGGGAARAPREPDDAPRERTGSPHPADPRGDDRRTAAPRADEPQRHPRHPWPPPWSPPWRRWLEEPRADRPLPWLSSLALLVLQLVGSSVAAANQLGDRVPLDPFARVLLVLGPVLLMLRHRWPGTVAFGTSAVATVYLAAGYPYGPIFASVAVAVFSTVVSGRRYAAWGAAGAFWAGHLVTGHWLYRWLPPSGDGPAPWGSELFILAWAAVIVTAAELARTRREEWLRRRAEAREAERRRADEERLRIARELHDVLAHSISVINVQAGVGLALLDSDPDQARTALTTIKAASKEVLGEVRQVLDTLRAPGDAPRAPAPGLGRLPELADQAEGAGLRVTTETEGAVCPLPPGADLAAFRVVQEALTNVVRHSASRTALVRLRYGERELELTVDDEGPAHGVGPTGGGNGLVGMRERASALGGCVEAGPRGDGGFRVVARLPLTSAGTAPDAAPRPDGPPDPPDPPVGPPHAPSRPDPEHPQKEAS
ncbi:sensor histidine kinase [Streptomyces sp. NPDC054796]